MRDEYEREAEKGGKGREREERREVRFSSLTINL